MSLTRASPESPVDVWWRAVIVVLAGLLAYANSLSGPMIIYGNVREAED